MTRSHDPPDRVPADPQQPRDRGLGHLLGQPRNDVLEVARVMGEPGLAHGTGSRRTPQFWQRSRRSSHSITQRLAPRSR